MALKLCHNCENGKINHDLFIPELSVNFDNRPTLKIPIWDAFNQKELVKGAQNLLMTSVGACAIAVDEALSAKHGKSSANNWINNPNDLNALREVIFLIRCAYAHKMPDVHWYISGKRRTMKYIINTPDGTVEFDANGKNGTKLEFSHFGDLKGFISLVHYASDSVR